MKLSRIVEGMNLRALTPEIETEPSPDVASGHASDLLSDVLANAPSGGVLVTIQVHMNVIAVAVHAGLVAVIFAAGRQPEEQIRQRAIAEKVRLYSCDEPAFDIVGKLYGLGIRGRHA